MTYRYRRDLALFGAIKSPVLSFVMPGFHQYNMRNKNVNKIGLGRKTLGCGDAKKK